MFKTGERQNVCTGDPLTPRSMFYARSWVAPTWSCARNKNSKIWISLTPRSF